MRGTLRLCVLALVLGSCTQGKVLTDPANGGSNSDNKARATLISITPSSLNGTVGQVETFSATVYDQHGHVMTGQSITWTSNNSQTASVSSAGVVTLLATGTASIAATSDSLTANANVTVTAQGPAPVATVRVSPTTVSLNPGGTNPLTAVALDANGNVVTSTAITWTSSNTSTATVSSSGIVTAIAVGSAIITASSQGKSATATATVVAASPASVARVTVSPSSASVTVGATTQLSATLYDSVGNVLGGRTITWSSNATGTATVSASGLVTGVAAGSASITASSGSKSATAGVTVTAVPVASVFVSPSSANLTVGQTLQLSATPKDASGNPLSGRPVTWSSSNTGAATVSGTGLVTAVAAGSATISATSGGKTGASTITVTNPVLPVTKVTVSPASATITVGSTQQFSATATDANGHQVTGVTFTWSSSNTAAATISSSGLATGITAGTPTITATTQGVSGTASLTVNAQSTNMNECATPGPGWIWCDDFEQDRTSSYFEYVNAGGNFVRVNGAGVNGSWGMQAKYVAGTPDAGNLKLAFGKTPSTYFKPVDAGTAQYRDIYWRVYVKNQAGWTGGGADKLSRALVFANSNWSEAAFAHVWSGTSAAGDPNQLLLNPASGTDTMGNLKTTTYNDFANMRWLGTDVAPLTLFDASHVAQWYCIEVHAKLNDAGSSNGVFEMWINGNLQAQQTGMNWLGSYSAYGWNAVLLENYSNAGMPVTEYRYLDDFVVSTQRIGCKY